MKKLFILFTAFFPAWVGAGGTFGANIIDYLDFPFESYNLNLVQLSEGYYLVSGANSALKFSTFTCNATGSVGADTINTFTPAIGFNIRGHAVVYSGGYAIIVCQRYGGGDSLYAISVAVSTSGAITRSIKSKLTLYAANEGVSFALLPEKSGYFILTYPKQSTRKLMVCTIRCNSGTLTKIQAAESTSSLPIGGSSITRWEGSSNYYLIKVGTATKQIVYDIYSSDGTITTSPLFSDSISYNSNGYSAFGVAHLSPGTYEYFVSWSLYSGNIQLQTFYAWGTAINDQIEYLDGGGLTTDYGATGINFASGQFMFMGDNACVGVAEITSTGDITSTSLSPTKSLEASSWRGGNLYALGTSGNVTYFLASYTYFLYHGARVVTFSYDSTPTGWPHTISGFNPSEVGGIPKASITHVGGVQ